MVKVTVELQDAQAWALGEYLKRVWYDDVRGKAVDDAECEDMREGLAALARALEAAGVCPR